MSRQLSDEERAAKEARLRELRSQLDAQQGASSPSAAFSNQDAEACIENTDTQDSDNYDDEEEFLQEEELAQKDTRGGICMYAKPMGELMGDTIETESNIRRCTVGDFELLRLAKMGDLFSFKEFSAIVGVDPTVFEDNHGRNALHYAADSGDVSMLQYLIDLKLPFKRDEKMMTPVDVAALNQHTEAVKLLAEFFSEAAEALKSHEEAVEAFARPPPKFTISRPAPPALKESRPRAFWEKSGGDVAAPPALAVSRLSEAQQGDVVAALSGFELSHGGCGLHNWLPLAEAATLSAILPRATVVGARQTVDGCERLCGLVMAVPLGGSLVDKKGAVKAEAPQLATQLAVHSAVRGKNIAASLMAELRRLLLTSGNTVVVFRSPLQLPVQAVGLLKWSQRSIAPCSVLRHRHAGEIFSDFYLYDEVLRADIIAKNALTKSFRTQKAQHFAGWRTLDRNKNDEVELLNEFLCKHLTMLFDFTYLPKTRDDLLKTLMADGLFPFIYVSPTTGNMTDFVVLRLRNAEDQRDQWKSVAMCVYAVFTSFKGPEKAEEVLLLAESLKCETVLIPNMFGFLDTDLSKAMFEELLGCREYLYVMDTAMECVLPPTPLSKVAIPCAFI